MTTTERTPTMHLLIKAEERAQRAENRVKDLEADLTMAQNATASAFKHLYELIPPVGGEDYSLTVLRFVRSQQEIKQAWHDCFQEVQRLRAQLGVERVDAHYTRGT